jgi:hypothetical protein
VRAVRGTFGIIARETRQITRVAPQLGRNAVVRMAANGEGKYHDTRREVADFSHDSSPCLIRVLKVGVGESSIAALADSKNLRRPVSLIGSQLGTASTAAFSRGQIQYPGPITGVDGLEQRAGAGELDVVAMGGDGQDIDRHQGNKARTVNGEQ